MNSQRSIDSELRDEESSETLDDESSFDEPGGETTRWALKAGAVLRAKGALTSRVTPSSPSMVTVSSVKRRPTTTPSTTPWTQPTPGTREKTRSPTAQSVLPDRGRPGFRFDDVTIAGGDR